MVQKNLHFRGRLRDKFMPRMSIASYLSKQRKQLVFASCCCRKKKAAIGLYTIHTRESAMLHRVGGMQNAMKKRLRCNGRRFNECKIPLRVWIRCNASMQRANLAWRVGCKRVHCSGNTQDFPVPEIFIYVRDASLHWAKDQGAISTTLQRVQV